MNWRTGAKPWLMVLPTRPDTGFSAKPSRLVAGSRSDFRRRYERRTGRGGTGRHTRRRPPLLPTAFRPRKGSNARDFLPQRSWVHRRKTPAPVLGASRLQNAVPVEVVCPGFVQIVWRKRAPVAAQLVDRRLAGVVPG